MEEGVETAETSPRPNSPFSELPGLPVIRKVDLSKEVEAISVETSCKDMVEKVAEFLNGEFTATSEDYKLLAELNKLTITKYEEMSTSTNKLINSMEEINEKYKKLETYLSQIDLLEESVLKLEQTAYKLDTYSKQLETKFRTMDKR